MPEKRYTELMSVISDYYSNGKFEELLRSKGEALSEKGLNNQLENTVGLWYSFTGNLGVEFSKLNIENISYQQFPNLKTIVKIKDKRSEIIVEKSIHIIFSLFGPYYTFYFSYGLKTELKQGFLPVGDIYFMDRKQFQELRLDIDTEKLKKTIKKYFPEYDYCNHFWLMVNKLDKSKIETENFPESTLFQLLFDPDQPSQIFL
jgi:hypothetical protein